MLASPRVHKYEARKLPVPKGRVPSFLGLALVYLYLFGGLNFKIKILTLNWAAEQDRQITLPWQTQNQYKNLFKQRPTRIKILLGSITFCLHNKFRKLHLNIPNLDYSTLC